MRKIIFVLALSLSFVGAMNAQVAGKAIGVRFANEFNGGELSFQTPLGSAKV